jgi:protein-S-isoprenylcysteine O-methyltransferase Ste14
MMQSENAVRRSIATSWLTVSVLALAMFVLIRGLVWLWGGQNTLDPAYGWLETWYHFYSRGPGDVWQYLPPIITVASLLFIALALWILGRKWSRNPQRVGRQALTLGSWALYLPAFLSGLPAVIGLVSVMVTPFLGGGLISIVATELMDRFGFLHNVEDWLANGMVTSQHTFPGVSYGSHTRFVVAQAIVAAGLAITIIGLIQVYRSYREKRLQTQGLYATVRHPQHLGITLLTFGVAFAVSSTGGYIMWLTVLYFYVLLALREERQLVQQFGTVYENYRMITPFIIPLVNIGLPLPRSGVLRIAALIGYYVAAMAVLCLILQKIGVQHPQFM